MAQLCTRKTVTVTEAFVLRPLLEDQVRITDSVCILVPIDRIKQKRFQFTTKGAYRSQRLQRKFCRQETGWEEHVQHEIFCVQWDVNLESIGESTTAQAPFTVETKSMKFIYISLPLFDVIQGFRCSHW